MPDRNAPTADRGVGTDPPSSDETDVLDELARVNNELVATQRALARRSGELDRAIARMNQVLGMAAHDLRNPIGSIRGLADTLLLRLADRLEPLEQEVLERIIASSDRVLRMADELLDLSDSHHEVRLDLEPTDLRTVVTEVLDVARVAADDKQVTVHLDAPTDILATVDAAKFDEVVINLVTNAIKYSYRGSDIEVTLRGDGDDAVLSVTDHGVGIALDEQDDIFRAFGKGSVPPTEGELSTGLGLAIADRITQAHGGRLTVDSAPGQGSTFTLRLPRRQARPDT